LLKLLFINYQILILKLKKKQVKIAVRDYNHLTISKSISP